MQHPDVVIAGAGVIGLTLALELRRQGRRVTVLERGTPGSGATSAAAGMLAVHDPANPPALLPLAQRSIELYPALFNAIEALVPERRLCFQTAWTLEEDPNGTQAALPSGLLAAGRRFSLLREHSVDPRRLFAALLDAAAKTGVTILSNSPLRSLRPAPGSTLLVDTPHTSLSCQQFVDCTGAWSKAAVHPVKGQMLRVHMGALNPTLPGRGNIVLRTRDIYLVPRTDGSMVIGATLEHKGFCTKTQDSTIADLRSRAAALFPAVAQAPELERWAGIRPGTADGLPLLGPMPNAPTPGAFIAAGHFRNGILLAPATARVMAQLLSGETPEVDISPFSPQRPAAAPAIA